MVSGAQLVGTGTNPAGSVTATVDTDCTITASDGTNPASMVSFTITVTDSAATNTKPVAPTIPDQTATVGAMFRFVVPAFTDADGDTLAYTVAGRPSWLDFDATTRTLSGTAAAGGPHTLTVTATDDGTPNLTSDPATFTLTVAPKPALPEFTIPTMENGNPRVDGGQVVVTVGLAEGSSPVTRDTTVTVRVTATNGYITGKDGNKTKTVVFKAGSTDNQDVRVDLDRRLGPDAMITAEVLPSNDYEVSRVAMAGRGVQAPIAAEDEARNVRGQYVEHALGGFARSMGWSLVESVRARTRVVGSGSMQRSSIDLSGLVDYAQARAGSDVDVKGLLALARATGEGDSEQSAAELSGLVKDYLQSRAEPEQAVDYFDAALETSETLAAHNGLPDPKWRDVRNLGDGGDAALASAAPVADGTAPSYSDHSGTSGSAWDSVHVWTHLKRDDLSFDDKGLDFKGDTTSLSIGIEKTLGSKGLLGVAVNWHDGKLDLTDDNNALAVSGEIKMEQWSLTPYVALATDHGRIWGSVGIGGGTLDYKDRHGVFTETGSSDVSMNVLAAGAEYDIMETHSWELLGRVEGMSANMDTGDEDDGLYGNQDVRVHGLRGEFEFAWPTVSASGDHYRPYLTAGYRMDEGDGTGGKAFEYGGGLNVDTGDFTFSGSARLQGLEGEGDYDRRSYTYAMAYDRGRDRRGLSLSVQNSYGSAESRDYFARQVPWARSAPGGLSADERSRTDMEAGYGFAVRGLLTGHSEGMLKPFVKTNLDGSAASEWSLGLTLESGFGNIGLEHTTRAATGGSRSRDQHEIQLNFKFDF